MSQGKYGLNFSAIAIVTFVLAFFNLPATIVLFLAYAVLLEKDQWLSRQVFQAFYLNIAFIVATTVVGWLFTAINAFFGLFDAYAVINVFNSIHSVIRFILNIALFVFALIAVLNLAKGKDANLPILSRLSDMTLGIFQKKTRKQPAQPTYPAQPAAGYQAPAQPYQAPTAPQQPIAPAPPPPVAPAPAPQAPSAPETPPAAAKPEPEAAEEPAPMSQETKAPRAPAGTWVCQCGRENTGNFCVSCGSPKPQ